MKKTKKYRKEKRKNQKGITLIALVITIVILIILATVAINAVFKDGGLIDQAELAKDLYNNSAKQEEESMSNLAQQLNGLWSGSDEEGVPPLDGSYSEEKGVNTPNIGNNMELIEFDEEKQEWVVDETNSAYDYVDTSVAGNENKSEWANAKVTIDGVESYFVWIPRYAYKITYYTDENKTTTSSTQTAYGTIDIKFIKDTGKTATDGTVCKYLSENQHQMII